jgi:hypothetical protein
VNTVLPAVLNAGCWRVCVDTFGFELETAFSGTRSPSFDFVSTNENVPFLHAYNAFLILKITTFLPMHGLNASDNQKDAKRVHKFNHRSGSPENFNRVSSFLSALCGVFV